MTIACKSFVPLGEAGAGRGARPVVFSFCHGVLEFAPSHPLALNPGSSLCGLRHSCASAARGASNGVFGGHSERRPNRSLLHHQHDTTDHPSIVPLHSVPRHDKSTAYLLLEHDKNASKLVGKRCVLCGPTAEQCADFRIRKHHYTLYVHEKAR